MSWTVTYREKDDLVFVIHQEYLNKDVLEKMLREVKVAGIDHHCNKYLLDFTESTINAKLFEIYAFAENIRGYGAELTDKVAVIIKNDIQNHLFFEIVVKNRGLSNIRYFMDCDSAMEWLLVKDQSM